MIVSVVSLYDTYLGSQSSSAWRPHFWLVPLFLHSYCFLFVFLLSLNSRSFDHLFFRDACAPAATCSYLTTICVLLVLFLFVSWEMPLFPSIMYYHYRFFFAWRARCTFSFRVVFFYLVPTGWILTCLSCENSIHFNQSKM